MENTNQILDSDSFEKDDKGEVIPYVSIEKFILLSILTFGLYEIWWMYKAWKLYQQRVDMDIMPAARAIFAIFFIYQLFEWIKDKAREVGYDGDYSSALLLIGFFVFNLSSRLPEPYWMVSFLSILIFLKPIAAFNYMLENSATFNGKLQIGFSGRQIALLIIGGLFWALVIIGLMVPDQHAPY